MEQTMTNLTDLEITRLKENGQYKVCKPAKARGSKSFSNFKSNAKRMKGYKQYDEPQGYKVSSIYNNGPELENDTNQFNSSNDSGRNSGKTTCASHYINSFNSFRTRNEGHWG